MLWLFDNPVKALARERDRAERALARAMPWLEVKPVRPDRAWRDVGIIASTYQPHNPLAAIFPFLHAGADEVVDPSGTLRYQLRSLPLHQGLVIGRSQSDYGGDSRAYFDAEISIPTLHHRRHAGERMWSVWMGLTPLEMWSQRSGIRAATGDVVLGGLGMGWLLSQIAEKRSVRSIVVVEQDKYLLDWFGHRLCDSIPKVKGVICADVFTVAERFDLKATRFVLDVWPNLGDAKWDRRLAGLREKGARVWAWGSAR